MTVERHQGNLELQWINKDKSLMYVIDETEGRGIKPTWVDKNDITVSEPRILRLVSEYGDPHNENMLIKGDNLLALRTLVEEFKDREEKDKVKCIYIDPPFNTGSAFEHYDDNLEHSQWLTMMRDRLFLLKKLLREDGIIFLHIDDTEFAHSRILLDEIFGMRNFVATIIWQKAYAPVGLRKFFSNNHDYIFVYAYNIGKLRMNLLKRSEKQDQRYKTPDNDPRGPWSPDNIAVGPIVEDQVYPIKNPSGDDIWPPKGYCWRFKKEKLALLLADNRIYFPKGGRSVPRIKRFLSEVRQGVVPFTIWLRDEVGDSQEAKREIKEIFQAETGVFETPKPERLIMRIIELATNPGDWVLDSFLGSGTTAAVAHKMGRCWIGIEIGQHAEILCLPRLKQVVSGENQEGISNLVGWKGGGGFRYYVVGSSILSSSDMNWELTFEELAEAVFMNFGFNKRKDPIVKGVFVGKSRKKGRFALCTVTKDIEIVKQEELMSWLKALKEKYGEWTEVEIYTNKGVGVRSDMLPDGVVLKKIPESLLAKYNL